MVGNALLPTKDGIDGSSKPTSDSVRTEGPASSASWLKRHRNAVGSKGAEMNGGGWYWTALLISLGPLAMIAMLCYLAFFTRHSGSSGDHAEEAARRQRLALIRNASQSGQVYSSNNQSSGAAAHASKLRGHKKVGGQLAASRSMHISDMGPGSIPKPCRLFEAGSCENGDTCPFKHVGREAQQTAAAAKIEKHPSTDVYI